MTYKNCSGGDLLKSSLKKYTYGQEKACLPEETISLALTRWQNLGFPLPEVLSLEEYDKLGLPVYTCLLPQKFPFPVESTFGKGVTPEQAKASALMELVERFSCFSFLRRFDQGLILTYTEVKDQAIPLDYLLSPFVSVYREPETLLALKDVPLIWTKAFELIEGKETLLPLPWFYHIYGTTGWAAGNTVEEAILQALCEIIERHCISQVIEERLCVPTIGPKSIESELIKDLLEKLAKAGLEIIIKDFSLDLGLSTIAAIAYDPAPIIPKLKFYATAGTHPNPELALIRALTELAQHRAQMIYRERVLKQPAGPTFCFPLFRSRDEVNFLYQGEKIPFERLPRFSFLDFKAEIEHLLSLLERQRFRVYVIETTHKDLDIPAVIVTIPGARLNRPSTKIHPYLLVARQLMNIGRYQEGTVFLEKAFAIQPSLKNSPQILCQAAVCYKKAKDYEKAAEYFRLAQTKAPYLLQSPKFMAEFKEVIKKASNSSLKVP